MIRNQNGFTLVELIVTMAVFIFVIMITSDAFNVIITQSSRLMRSEESNIEGVIGLEQFRHDIQQGGYGLPYQYSGTAPVYSEAATGLQASTYNDAPSGIPRAFSSGDNLPAGSIGGGLAGNILAGSDYLVIRGTTVGRTAASQRWTYLRYSSSNPIPNAWPYASENIQNGARVIVLNRTFGSGNYTNQLVTNSSLSATPGNIDYYSTTYGAGGLPAEFTPKTPNESYVIYGIDTSNIRMPFNRSDYFVSRPTAVGNMPTVCAPNTGILYKTTVQHIDGTLNYIPIVDCVADMQVVYGWDLKNGGVPGTDGLIDTYSRADGGAVSGAASIAEVQVALTDAAAIRNSLKMIKVYLLVQNGGKDNNYTSPASFNLFDEAQASLSRIYTLTPEMRNYRWKVYRIVVRPKNLTSNQ